MNVYMNALGECIHGYSIHWLGCTILILQVILSIYDGTMNQTIGLNKVKCVCVKIEVQFSLLFASVHYNTRRFQKIINCNSFFCCLLFHVEPSKVVGILEYYSNGEFFLLRNVRRLLVEQVFFPFLCSPSWKTPRFNHCIESKIKSI